MTNQKLKLFRFGTLKLQLFDIVTDAVLQCGNVSVQFAVAVLIARYLSLTVFCTSTTYVLNLLLMYCISCCNKQNKTNKQIKTTQQASIAENTITTTSVSCQITMTE